MPHGCQGVSSDCPYTTSAYVSAVTTRRSYDLKYYSAMAADREKRLELVDVMIVVSHKLCRCLRLFQPQLLHLSPLQHPGTRPDGSKWVRNFEPLDEVRSYLTSQLQTTLYTLCIHVDFLSLVTQAFQAIRNGCVNRNQP